MLKNEIEKLVNEGLLSIDAKFLIESKPLVRKLSIIDERGNYINIKPYYKSISSLSNEELFKTL